MVYKWSSRFQTRCHSYGGIAETFFFLDDVVSNNKPYSAGIHEEQAHLQVPVLMEIAVSLRTQDLLQVPCEAPSFLGAEFPFQ